MIDGDIDLTEDLDFYHDRKLPVYHNNVDLVESKKSVENSQYYRNNIIWNIEPQDIVITTSSNRNYRNYSNTILRATNYYYENNWNTLTYDTTYEEPIFIQNEDGSTITLKISYSSGNITYNVADHKTSAQKLFGDRAEWVPIRYIEDILGKREELKYHNTKDFDTWETIHISMSGWYSRHDREPTSAEELFGTREDPYIDEPMIPIPWLEHMSMSEYRDYIDEISGNEKDYSSYLTNYGWLRMH